jgi:hypothetical protein
MHEKKMHSLFAKLELVTIYFSPPRLNSNVKYKEGLGVLARFTLVWFYDDQPKP